MKVNKRISKFLKQALKERAENTFKLSLLAIHDERKKRILKAKVKGESQGG